MRSTVDPNDFETWSTLATAWEDSEHGLNTLRLYTPLRVNFLIDSILKSHVIPSTQVKTPSPNKPLSGYRILEVGCGGGYVSEALAEKGASVVAVDCNPKVIKANQARQLKEASTEMLRSCLYLKSTAEELVRDKELADQAMNRSIIGRILSCLWTFGQSEIAAAVIPRNGFDIVVASEVLEHVRSPRFFLKCLDDLLKPDGLLMITTPNRTWLSRFALITMAEKILKMVPLGVHSYSKFVRHDELAWLLNATERRSCNSFCLSRFLEWPRLCIRSSLGTFPVSSMSPLYPTVDDATLIKTSYQHIGTQGVFFVPKLNFWTRVPTKCIAYMATFKKSGMPKSIVHPMKDEL